MFLTIWNPFGPIWTLFDYFKWKIIFCSKAPSLNPTLSLWGNKLLFVWNGPKVSIWAQKGPKLSKTSRFTISDPFRPLWTTLECWQACYVWPFLFVLLVRFFWDTLFVWQSYFLTDWESSCQICWHRPGPFISSPGYPTPPWQPSYFPMLKSHFILAYW